MHDALLTLGGFVLLMVDYQWFEYRPSSSPDDSLPGWSVTVLLLASAFFLCWVAYTVQCRRMVPLGYNLGA